MEPSFHSHPKVNETHIKVNGLKYSIDLKLSCSNHIITLKGKTYPSFFLLFCYVIEGHRTEKYQVLL